jgi:hypothetical protein
MTKAKSNPGSNILKTTWYYYSYTPSGIPLFNLSAILAVFGVGRRVSTSKMANIFKVYVNLPEGIWVYPHKSHLIPIKSH